MKSRKSQYAYVDYITSMIIITACLVIFFNFVSNLKTSNEGSLDELIQDSKIISDSLLSQGYPSEWDSTNVHRIGLTDGYYHLLPRKVREFSKMEYSKQRLLFGTTAHYQLYFIDKDSSLVNINGVCYVGKDTKVVGTNKGIAYYSKNKKGMEKNLTILMGADSYNELGSAPDGNFDDLIANLSNYDIVFLEYPEIGRMPGFDSSTYITQLENFVSSGGFLFLTGDVNVSSFLGVSFIGDKGSGNMDVCDSCDAYLDLSDYQGYVFNPADRFTFNFSTPPSNFILIAEHQGQDKPAVARWSYGNGFVYYLAGTEFTGNQGNLNQGVINAINSITTGECGSFNIENFYEEDPNKILKIERYVFYNSNILRMVLYLWE